jgi:hypothetical protein
MSSYIEQLKILRDINRESLQKQVDEFLLDKCEKRVINYVNNTPIDKIPKFEAYIYYIDPPNPIMTSISTDIGATYITFETIVSSPIYLTIKQSGIYYNTTGIQSIYDKKVLLPNNYGIFTVTITDLTMGQFYYFTPFLKICNKIIFYDIIKQSMGTCILDSYEDFILDSYGDFILES